MNAVDTNVMVYACDRRDASKQMIAQRIVSETLGGVLLWQVACEFVSVSRKLAGDGFTELDAQKQLGEYLAVYRLSLPGSRVLDIARELHLHQRWSYWDALLVAACLEAGVTRLYSEDLPGRAPPEGLEIVNPFG